MTDLQGKSKSNAKCYIYFNLTKKCFSVKYQGKVIMHCYSMRVKEPRFIVSLAGRDRVLQDKRKNVHAYVVADPANVTFDLPTDRKGWIDVTYNPYRSETFTRKDSGSAIFHASEACLYKNDLDKASICVI